MKINSSFLQKKIVIALLAFSLGAISMLLLLFYQIENRYKIGRNAGKLEGAYSVIDFLNQTIDNDTSEAKSLNQHFPVKCTDISVVEIKGVKTIIIKE